MRYTVWTFLAVASLALGACGSQEQPPAKPVPPAVPAVAPPPAAPAPSPSTSPSAPVTVVAPPAKEPGAVAVRPSQSPAKPAFESADIPETIVIAASQGQVHLSHLAHARKFPCATCHGDGKPGKLDLTKDTAHELCRDCHKAKGAGPATCTGCHKK